MFLVMSSMILITLIVNLMMLISVLISKKSFKDREKNSPFECGFDPFNSARLPFSMQFFLIAVIFLIFDIEITLIIPMIYIFKISKLSNFFFTLLFFILILIIGLFHEWFQGALNWK
uniref:NADH-ubiquinone oxidoreductase chain 3 n=1 Tax=Curculionoidea sp. 10 KM-2017 TaxID=2219393 RepID=A0A346RI99_9CUCU|nr:NADH dehydrogenase subunit 3 [Curculionoidea sp. 10 KM-2017]